MRRFILLLLSTVVCLSLAGCAIEADRIYTVCRIDNGTRYVYDGSGNFYTVMPDETLQPNIDPSLINKPVLMVLPKEGEFVFESMLPGFYKGTLESINHYVYAACSDLSQLQVVYADAKRLEIVFPSGEDNIRILYNIKGDVRIYSTNNNIPVYLNGK